MGTGLVLNPYNNSLGILLSFSPRHRLSPRAWHMLGKAIRHRIARCKPREGSLIRGPYSTLPFVFSLIFSRQGCLYLLIIWDKKLEKVRLVKVRNEGTHDQLQIHTKVRGARER